MRFPFLVCLSATVLLTISAAQAETISTHVLDLARGVGGRGVPVILAIKQQNGSWKDLASARTDENGRVRSFGDHIKTETAVYKLTFDMSHYGAEPSARPFFPEIDVVFQVTDPTIHYHVPVVVSPYGYSTYRGN